MNLPTRLCTRPRRQLLAAAGAAIAASTLLFATVPGHAMTTGSGHATSETRVATGFQSISLRGGIHLIVRQGTSEGVTVRADDNVLPLVQTLVEGSGDARTLRVQFKPGESLRTKTQVLVTVDVVKLSSVASSGAGDITVEALKTPGLTLSIAGSSNAQLRQLDTELLSISITGSGDVQASGRASRLDVSIAGSGDVRTRDLVAADVSVSIAGSGDASVTAQKTISIAIAGSGDVEYGGNAALVKRSIAGSGSVRQRQP